MPHTVDAQAFTVIVVVDADPPAIDSMMRHAARGLQQFAGYPGFVGGALHVAVDGRRMVQHVQWADEAAYLACRDDPAWDDDPSTLRFAALIATGKASLDERSYEVVATT